MAVTFLYKTVRDLSFQIKYCENIAPILIFSVTARISILDHLT